MSLRVPAWTGAGCALLLACAALLCACSQKPVRERAPEAGDKAVAMVNGQTVWASDVKREAVSQGLIGEGEPLDISSDSFHQMLDEVVDEKLLAAEAIKHKLDKDPMVQRRFAAARDQILGNTLVKSVVDQAVSDQAVQTLYQEQLSRSKLADEIHARQIVVATAADAETIKKLLSAGASFESLAIEKSIDQATRFNGGDLGYFTTDVMPSAYEASLKEAKAGEIVGPVKIDNGFAVIKVEDRRPEQPVALDQARPQIVRFLTYNQVRDLLKRLRDQSKVKLLIAASNDVPGAPTEPASAPPAAAPPSSAPASSAPSSSAPHAVAPARPSKARSDHK